MSSWKHFFKGKRVTVIGLGLLGRGLGDAIFLAEHKAELIVTDLRDEKTLAPSLARLKDFKNIHYTLGKHKLEDFRNRDFILKAAGVALDSPYIAEARKHGVPIEMDASLFAKLMPKGVTLVGVTGTRGKSTVTALIYEILNAGFKIQDSRFKIYRGGNLVPEATLPLLEKVKKGDIVVLELDSWQLQGFHDAKLSPQVAVFTTFLDDHLVYYKGDTDRYFEDKVAIFKYQKGRASIDGARHDFAKSDVLVAGEQIAQNIGKSGVPVNGDFVVAKKEDIPNGWNIPLLGEHNLENIACAVAAARAVLRTPDVGDSKHRVSVEDAIQKAVEDFKAVSGRLEFIREVKGVKIYNDNNATTPDATIAALRALSSLSSSFIKGGARVGEGGGFKNPSPQKTGVLPLRKGELRHIILIMGGTDKVLGKHGALITEIIKRCKAAVMLKETGTEILLAVSHQLLGKDFRKLSAKSYQLKATNIYVVDTLQECVQKAMKLAKRGDVVLFSPAFASFGKWFKNECDRGEQFVKLIEKL